MEELEKATDPTPERPAGIARIAYSQAGIMTRYKCTMKKKLAVVPKDESGSFLQHAIFETITSTFCNAYTTVKESNETITDILNRTEKSIGKGSEFIGNTIEKFPSIDSPANEFLRDFQINFRLTFLSTIEWCEKIAASVMSAFNSLSITNEDQTEKTKEPKS